MTTTLINPSVLSRLNAPTLHRLSNGLTVIAEHLPVEAVNLSIWLPVGSAIESDDINGMAHFLEHMVFKGTNSLGVGDFEAAIEARGAITNAATSQDYTHYYITTAPKDFAALAPLQFDVVLNPAIPSDAFERERHVVLEEIRRSDDNPRRRTFQHAVEATFERLPYRRQVLGPASVVEQLTPEQMREFHGQYYHPSAMTVAVVGNLPVDELLQIVETGITQVTGDRRHRLMANPLKQPLLPEPSFTSIVRREVVDDSLQQARLVMTWRVPGMQDLYQTHALDMLASVLGHGRTARLIQDLRESRHLVSNISVSNLNYGAQGMFYISAHLPAEHLETVEAAIAEHIRRLHTELVTDHEMKRMRTQVANRFIFGNETPSDRASMYGYYQAMVGDLAPALNYPAHIQALSAVDLQTAAQRYLSPDAYAVTLVKPS